MLKKYKNTKKKKNNYSRDIYCKRLCDDNRKNKQKQNGSGSIIEFSP